MEENWSLKTCFMLCIGMSICALSYYNSYTWILMSILFYFVSYFKKNPKDFKGFVKFSSFIVIVTLAFISYIFIRHLVLYNDLLGLNISREYGEAYGVGSYKPSLRSTPSNSGVTLKGMLIDKMWLIISYKSFIGVLGCMNIFLRKDAYSFYTLFFIVAIIGVAFGIIRSFIKKEKPDLTKLTFVFALLFCIAGALFLSVYYSYFNDFQPQGRYCFPALPAIAIIAGFGFSSLLEKLKKEHQYAVTAAICAIFTVIDVDALITLIY